MKIHKKTCFSCLRMEQTALALPCELKNDFILLINVGTSNMLDCSALHMYHLDVAVGVKKLLPFLYNC